MKLKYILFSTLIITLNILCINASCTDKELNDIKADIKNIKITYKHLGKVTKDDGSIAYNEFLVTATNIPNEVYVHLNPFADNEFIKNEDNLQIKLTTGKWQYNMYSSKCEKTVDTIEVKLPRFNEYSLDPLCIDIDPEDFPLCGKYFEYEVSKESFARKVNTYRKENHIGEKKKEEIKESKILDNIFNFIKEYKLYILCTLGLILTIIGILIIISKRKNKNVLK